MRTFHFGCPNEYLFWESSYFYGANVFLINIHQNVVHLHCKMLYMEISKLGFCHEFTIRIVSLTLCRPGGFTRAGSGYWIKDGIMDGF